MIKESLDSRITKCIGLTDEQKKRYKAFFKEHPELEDLSYENERDIPFYYDLKVALYETAVDELEDYQDSLPTIDSKLKGYDFPFMQVGTRPEGKVFMSKYTTPFEVPFSPYYKTEGTDVLSCNWKNSLLRQWLNSDEAAGQWFKDDVVNDYSVSWKDTPKDIVNFIKNTPGFLRMIGLSKSDLTPVTNVTYTSEGTPIRTVDYVWTPSLSEMSTASKYNEGNPLEYWKKVLGNKAAFGDNDYRTMQSVYLQGDFFWTRTFYDDTNISYVETGGAVWNQEPIDPLPVVALFCLKR